jgi:MoaA/NifB/PqqE/SkfB family radical SAM enzyme
MMNKNTIPSPDDLRAYIDNRRVFIWGARHEGYSTLQVFQRLGFPVEGFIDSSLSLQGTQAFELDILLPETFLEVADKNNAFIVIASGFFADEIAKICSEHGFGVRKDFISYHELKRFNYQVDISGVCNLKCISCPRGNFEVHRPAGFMSAEIYAQVLEKILQEDPYTGIITLYNWGEPLLNKDLPEIIKITTERGVHSAVSTNLSLKIDFEKVIKAKPTWFRVSNSGWGKNYEITHTGGDWELFLRNLYKLKEYKEKHHPEMLVEVFFHIYSHNRDDYDKMQTLCDELGFTLRYRHAALAPLDNIEKVIDGVALDAQSLQTRELQFLKVEEVIPLAMAQKDRPCYYETHLWINWDLHVAQCMEWYRPDLNLVESSFLDTPIDALWKAREESEFCKKCKAKGIHRVYCVYGDEKLIHEKHSLPIIGALFDE